MTTATTDRLRHRRSVWATDRTAGRTWYGEWRGGWFEITHTTPLDGGGSPYWAARYTTRSGSTSGHFDTRRQALEAVIEWQAR